MTDHRYEIDVNVYSVVTIPSQDVERVTAQYLYGHTVVEIGFDLPNDARVKHSAVVLKTTTTEVLDPVTGSDDAGNIYGLLRRANQLAEYQVDRFASGLYPGRVCGSLQAANEFVLDIAK